LSPTRIAETARAFLNLVVAPPLVRALFGENLDVLRRETALHAARKRDSCFRSM
jgi:hypothetical protein